MITRRDFTLTALGAAPFAAALANIDSKVHGVQFGLVTYVFSLPGSGPRATVLDTVIQTMVQCGLGECEAFSPLLEPGDLSEKSRSQTASADERTQARDELTKWRASVGVDYYEGIRKKFNAAGIEIFSYGANPGATDEAINRTFAQAKALGARIVTTGMSMSAAKRVAPIAEQQGMMVGLQGNPNMNATNPDAIAKPEQFLEAVALSKQFRICLDIGDATRGGWDALQFVRDHPESMAIVFVKDRKKDGTSVPYGEGDSHVKEILQLIRDKQYPMRAYLDCDYATDARADVVKKSYEYAKSVLGS